MAEHPVLRIDDLHVSAGRGVNAPAILKGFRCRLPRAKPCVW